MNPFLFRIVTVFLLGVASLPVSVTAADEAWKEVKTGMPAPPETKALLPVEMPPTIKQKVYIDPKSISRAADWVVRYTVVIKSSSGVQNVFFEGIRCATEEYKSYAYLAERSFKPIRDAHWRRIPSYGTHLVRLALMEHYFCNDYDRARSPKEIIKQIKYPENPYDWVS